MVIVYGLFYFEKNSIEYGLKVEKLLYVMKKNVFRKCMEISEKVRVLGKFK